MKGADRKHKQDKEKISKRPPTEQQKYQDSYECTVLNDVCINTKLVIRICEIEILIYIYFFRLQQNQCNICQQP